MSQITTHILDTARGCPAEGVAITLYRQEGEIWVEIKSGRTDQDGRISDLCAKDTTLNAGTYLMHFSTESYFQQTCTEVFYPWVDVFFEVKEGGEHYHIPLLLSPYGYSTYRGS